MLIIISFFTTVSSPPPPSPPAPPQPLSLSYYLLHYLATAVTIINIIKKYLYVEYLK
jgi:hypothetical protein